jgi:ubiquitin-protein ligase E3 C
MQTTSDATYLRALSDLVTGILTIPLLPNHFPLHSLTALSSGLPIASLSYLEPLISTLVASLTVGSCINLIANMLVFTQPRYAKLTRKSMDVYLLLLTALFNALPANALTPPTADGSAAPSAAWSTVNADSDDEDDEDGVSVSVVSAFSPPSSALPPPPTPASKLALQQLDAKTLKRLSVIPTPTHLQALLDHPNRMRLAEFVFALNAVWPAQKGTVLSACVAKGGGRLVSELYRQHVRRSKIGKDHYVGALVGRESIYSLFFITLLVADLVRFIVRHQDSDGDSWLPLVFLADVYTQALLTMGDDEFFSSNASSSVTVAAPRTAAARNPLTLDELTSFSRQLLNIAFALYWREDQAGVSWDGAVKGDVVSIKLERVREIVTRCLVAIHARE